jgi:hypothetical protein
MFTTRQLTVPTLAVGILALAACQFDHEATGPLQEEPVSVDLGNTERANLELDMGAGEMNVRGGASKLLEGRFEYNVPAWKPELHTSDIGSHATITIRQPEYAHLGGSRRYIWDLQLNNRVLLDLALRCGAGKAQLDLGDLDLRSVDVQMGTGQVDLDLRGKPSRDYDVNISGGVGQATVHLPQDVGVMAEAHGGIGSITVTGLQKRGDRWQNDLYDTAKVNVRLKVEGGIGEIRIIG